MNRPSGIVPKDPTSTRAQEALRSAPRNQAKRKSSKGAALQARFVEEYLRDLNATQAAVRAGYSMRTARRQASRLLTKVDIAQAIQRAIAQRSERTGIARDRVLSEVGCLAFSNITHYTVDQDGRLVPANGAPADAMKAVASFKSKRTEFGVEFEIKLWDKPSALKLAGRHVGLFPDRLEVTGRNRKPITAEAIRTESSEELVARTEQLLKKARA